MIKTGFYEADITPAIGMERPGNYFKVFIREIREQLKVRACYITDGKTEVALVGIDTCSISPEISDPVRAEFPGMTVLLSPSHLHNGGPATSSKIPDYYSDLAKKLAGEESIQGNPDYIRQVILQTVSAIKMAKIKAEEVELSFGRGNVEGVTFNRGFKMKNGHRATHPGKCNPEIVAPFAPIDTEVGAVGFWRKSDESFLGCLVTFNCHGTCAAAGGVNTDWPGQMIRTIKAVMGENSGVTYLYGCAGDITQIDNLSLSPVEGGPKSSETVGVSVGAEALKILMKAKKGGIETLKTDAETIALQRRIPSKKTLDEALRTVRKWERDTTEFRFAKAKLMLGEIAARKPEMSAEIQTIQIGPLVIVTIPGELFCGIGMAIKAKSKFPFTWVSSLANASIGYIPTSDALDPKTGGGYETRLTSGTCAAPDTDRKLIEKSVEMIGKLDPDPVPVGPQIEPVTKIWEYGNNLPELE
jgi:hypothetical protein